MEVEESHIVEEAREDLGEDAREELDEFGR